MRKRTKWLCSVLLVATIGLTGCGQKQKTESRAEKSDENHFVGEWIVEPEYAISKVGDENTLFVDGRGEKKAAGYEDVKMVDGGWKALKDSGIKTQFLASKPEPAEVKIDEIDYSHVMTTEELQKNYDEYKIVDVRTDEEYEGAILYDEAKGGHLPGAIHIRYTDLFDDAGYLKSNEELTKMFEDAGLSKDDEIVTYCTGGIRSAYTQLVMEMCGFEHTYNYDQSFWRWAVVGDVE